MEKKFHKEISPNFPKLQINPSDKEQEEAYIFLLYFLQYFFSKIVPLLLLYKTKNLVTTFFKRMMMVPLSLGCCHSKFTVIFFSLAPSC